MKLLIIFFIKLILFIIAIPISIKIEKKILVYKDAEVKKLRKLLQEAVDEKNRIKCLNQDLIEEKAKLISIIDKSKSQTTQYIQPFIKIDDHFAHPYIKTSDNTWQPLYIEASPKN